MDFFEAGVVNCFQNCILFIIPNTVILFYDETNSRFWGIDEM